MLVAVLLAVAAIGCDSGSSGSKEDDKKLRDAFTNRPKREDLTPAGQANYDQMKKMAESMKTAGPKGAAAPKPGN